MGARNVRGGIVREEFVRCNRSMGVMCYSRPTTACHCVYGNDVSRVPKARSSLVVSLAVLLLCTWNDNRVTNWKRYIWLSHFRRRQHYLRVSDSRPTIVTHKTHRSVYIINVTPHIVAHKNTQSNCNYLSYTSKTARNNKNAREKQDKTHTNSATEG